MDKKDIYKLFQLSDVLVSKYEYTQVMIKQYEDTLSNEAWLLNSKNTNYQVIRLTFSSASQYIYDEKRIQVYLDYFKKSLNRDDIKFLDIHISNDKYDSDNEPYEYINLDDNYSDGVDIFNAFPELYNAIHLVKNENKEISKIVSNMKKSIKNKLKKKSILDRNRYICTYIIIGICIVVYILSLFLKYKYSDTSSVFVALGADYKTFTLGLKQYYRLFTYAFVHNDIIHLLCNMISLYSIGRYVESRYGHVLYLFILVFSIVCGSLCQGILSDNSICIGLSAGIYGLLVAFIIDIYKLGAINIRSLMPTIFINLFLNFLSTTAWMAHLGGAIGGFIVYYFLQDTKDVPRIVMLVVVLLSLVIKYVTIDSIKSIFAGTDLNVVKIYQDIGLEKYASKLMVKLLDFYNRFGG